jgi:hemerythrin
MKKWSEQFTMGVADLDQDHRQLLRVAEMIAERVDHPETDPKQWPFLVREGLKYMSGYYESHIHKEEAYMLEINYPHYESHKAIHEEMERTVTQYINTQIETENCQLDDVLKLLGATYGWQMTHIAMDDMAIVRKGALAMPEETELNDGAVLHEIDVMLGDMLDFHPRTKIVNSNYQGSSTSNVACQKMCYTIAGTDVNVVFGLDQSLLRYAIHTFWEDKKVDNAIDKAHMILLQWCLTSFTVGFWRNMIARFTHDQPCVLKEVTPLDIEDTRQVMKSMEFSHSTLYETTRGGSL